MFVAEQNWCAQPKEIRDGIVLVQSEFLEMPGLRLSKRQAQRMWHLDPEHCDAIFDALERSKFLARTLDGSYIRADISY